MGHAGFCKTLSCYKTVFNMINSLTVVAFFALLHQNGLTWQANLQTTRKVQSTTQARQALCYDAYTGRVNDPKSFVEYCGFADEMVLTIQTPIEAAQAKQFFQTVMGKPYGCYNRKNGEFVAISKLDKNSKINLRCGFISQSSITRKTTSSQKLPETSKYGTKKLNSENSTDTLWNETANNATTNLTQTIGYNMESVESREIFTDPTTTTTTTTTRKRSKVRRTTATSTLPPTRKLLKRRKTTTTGTEQPRNGGFNL